MQLYRLPDTRIKKESDNSLWVLFEIWNRYLAKL
jgi:hypothetical protein